MKRFILLSFVLFLFKNIAVSQTNLIQNSSFESVSYPLDCNGGAFEIAGSPSFHHVVDNWYTLQSPDYFTSQCNTGTSYYNVPSNLFGISYAKTQNSYVGIGVFDIRFNYQEYIYQNLSSLLKADSVYCLSFFVSRADRFPFAVKQIGAYFSNNLPSLSSGYVNAAPQIINNTGFITDTVNWVEIQGCFTAQGGEQYITIGNFNSNANTDTLRIQSTNPLTGIGTDVSYYYIDSVSLWQNNFPTFIKDEQKNEFVSVWPNPANGVINFKFSYANTKRKIELYNTIGELVLSEVATTQDSSLKTHHLQSGIYFVKVVYANGLSVVKKIIKQ